MIIETIDRIKVVKSNHQLSFKRLDDGTVEITMAVFAENNFSEDQYVSMRVSASEFNELFKTLETFKGAN